MSHVYKIETYCDTCAQHIAFCIEKAGGHAVIRSWAIITDHLFNEQQTHQVLHLIAKVTDEISDDDMNTWIKSGQLAA